jgi:hypothetical protein
MSGSLENGNRDIPQGIPIISFDGENPGITGVLWLKPEEVLPERKEEEYLDPQTFAQVFHGQRAWPLESIGAPQGWVVNGELSPEIWEKIQTTAIPLMPGGGGEPEKVAQKQIQGLSTQYDQEVFRLIVADDETESGWSCWPIILSDLDKDPKTLLVEATAASKKKDRFLLGMKRCAYLAVTGMTDTK